MSERIHFLPLGSKDAGKISRLQKQLFAPELTEPEADIRQILLNTEQHLVCNLSYGVFDGSAMVGYAFIYVETQSLFHQRAEDVVYIKEVGLQPGYEAALRPLFQKLVALRFAFVPDLPIEAHAQIGAVDGWGRLKRYFDLLGITVTSRVEPSRAGQPSYHLLRLDFSSAKPWTPEIPLRLPKARWSFGTDYSVCLIKDSRQWLSLQSEWDELQRNDVDSTVFESFAYLWEWWKHFGIWAELFVIAIYQADKLVGLVPLMIDYESARNEVTRRLQLIGSAMATGQRALIVSDQPARIMDVLAAYLLDRADDWDTLDLDGLDIALADSLRSHFNRSRFSVSQSTVRHSYVNLKKRVPASDVESIQQRTVAGSAINMRVVNSLPVLATALESHDELEAHDSSMHWSARLAGSMPRNFFYHGLARVFGEQGRFELRALESDGQVVASTFGIRDADTFYSLRSTHDSRRARLHPAKFLLARELTDLAGNAVGRYEFVKRRSFMVLPWAAAGRVLASVHVRQHRAGVASSRILTSTMARWCADALQRMGRLDSACAFLGRFRVNPLARFILRL